MNPIEALAKVGELIKLFNVIEEKQKQQEAEIIRLREDNASLRKEVAGLTERVARLEESRHTLAAETKLALVESMAEWERKARSLPAKRD